MYKIEDIEIGNQVMFKRTGVPDFDLDWIVVGFFNEMIEVKIDYMGYNEQLFIHPKDIIRVLTIKDMRF